MATILCVDDEPSVGVIMEHTLTKIGHRPLLVSSVEEAMQTVTRTPLDLIIADYRMPRLTGLDLLGLLEKEGYRVPVIIMTGYSSIEHAVISIKTGAIDYLTKPIRAETLEIAVQQALEVVRLRRENETFRRKILKIRCKTCDHVITVREEIVCAAFAEVLGLPAVELARGVLSACPASAGPGTAARA